MKNKRVQAEMYIKFCIFYRVPYLQPSILQVAMYAKFLGNSFASPASVKNYLSGAKSWVTHHCGNPSAFLAQEAVDVVKYVSSSSNHVTAPAYPLSANDLLIICEFLDVRPHVPTAIKACILIGFASFLRASNITSPTLQTWGGPHTLRVCDILDSSLGLNLVVYSTKSFHASKPTIIKVLPVKDSPLCPVQAWKKYKDSVRPLALGPAFMLNLQTPLTTRPVVDLMLLALATAGHPFYHLVSMHSLRRGGVQLASHAGADEDALMIHGTWKSKSGIKPYLSQDQSMIPQIIAESLAK